MTDDEGLGGWLNGWIDLDRNGDWLGPDEHFLREPVGHGPNQFQRTIPAHATAGQTYVRFRLSTESDLGPGGSAPDGEVEDYRVNVGGEHIGVTTFKELEGLNPLSGDIWYRMETSQAGFLTIEATYGWAGGGDASLTLYDPNGNLLASSSTGSGLERIDHQAAGSGEVYYLKVEGDNGDVDIRLANLVNVAGVGGDEVTISGTDGADVFVCTPSDTSFDCSINGLEYSLTPPDSGSLYVTAKLGEGNDSFTFQGNGGKDAVRTSSTGAEVDGQIGAGLYFLQVESAEDITANGGGGDDVAVLRDSDGEDRFSAGPGWAEMSGPGSSQEVNNFSTIIGIASDDGQRDVAELEGQPGSKPARAERLEGHGRRLLRPRQRVRRGLRHRDGRF